MYLSLCALKYNFSFGHFRFRAHHRRSSQSKVFVTNQTNICSRKLLFMALSRFGDSFFFKTCKSDSYVRSNKSDFDLLTNQTHFLVYLSNKTTADCIQNCNKFARLTIQPNRDAFFLPFTPPPPIFSPFLPFFGNHSNPNININFDSIPFDFSIRSGSLFLADAAKCNHIWKLTCKSVFVFLPFLRALRHFRFISGVQMFFQIVTFISYDLFGHFQLTKFLLFFSSLLLFWRLAFERVSNQFRLGSFDQLTCAGVRPRHVLQLGHRKCIRWIHVGRLR